MPLGFLGSLFGSAIGAGASYANTKQINETNLQIARETNAANREMVELQNKAAKEEAELAYQRSKPTTQVQNMQAAGMSRAGAINMLNGGGSYTPSPVNVSQDQAAKMETADLSALANIGQGLSAMAEHKHQKKMQDAQIEAAKEQQNALLNLERDKLEFEKQKWNDEKEYRAINLEKLGLERDLMSIEKEVAEVTNDGRINKENAENLAAQSQAILDDIRSKRVVESMSRMTDEELDNLFELQATLNMLQQGLQYDSTSVVIKAAKKLGKFIGGAKGAGKNIRTH